MNELLHFVEEHVERLRQGRERIRNVLARHTPSANEKARIIERLEQLLNMSENAVSTATEAVTTARKHMEDLRSMFHCANPK